MKVNWFKKSKMEIPDFWQEYLDSFKSTKNNNFEEMRFVVFDTETTGFNRILDRVLSIGAVSVIHNSVNVADSFEVYIKQQIFRPESVPIHGILKQGELEKISENEAMEQFLKYINNAVLIGHHVNFDIEMINQILQRNGLGVLQNITLDTGTLYKKSKHRIYKDQEKNYSLDDLIEALNVPNIDRHTATGDALITALVYLKILSRIKQGKSITLKDLLS
jgi:DNA polymerase-3 subunit epsilon